MPFQTTIAYSVDSDVCPNVMANIIGEYMVYQDADVTGSAVHHVSMIKG
jgi:hypothetical protein